MKMLFVSNENLAATVKQHLASYFYKPEVEVICFPKSARLKAAARLQDYIQSCLTLNPDEKFLVLADYLGSTAFNETALLLQRLGLMGQSLVIPGLNLSLATRLYNYMKEHTFEAIRQLFPTRSFIQSFFYL